MKITEIIKSKKFKNTIVTLLEIIVIAGVIMAILLTVQSKLKDRSGTGISIGSESEEKQEQAAKEEVIDEYHIEVNIKKSAVIVYQYNKDKSAKNPIKVMKASIGKGVKADKYKLQETYTWLNSNESIWNKYNSRYSNNGWIQSVNYDDKYSWTFNKESFEALGNSQSEDSNIKLMAKDAQWIFANCAVGTVVRIKKGKDADVLPAEFEAQPAVYKTCGWEPTDPEKGNPYSSVANGTVAAYNGVVYIEKGSAVNYQSNLLALNEQGNNITKKLKYSEFNSSEMGQHEVKYSFTTGAGTKLEAVVKYEVIDTTVPVVKLSKTAFTYEVKSDKEKDLNTKTVKEDIEELVEKSASANEGEITATTVPKSQLAIGVNYVYVVAKDSAGNVGTAQAIVEIKVKEKEKSDKKDDSKGELSTTKKKKEEKTTEAKKENKTEKEEEVTVEIQTEAPTEAQTEVPVTEAVTEEVTVAETTQAETEIVE